LKEMALICSQLFSGEVMSSFLIWAKLCAGKSAIGLSIYAQNAGDFMRRKRQGYALSDNDELRRYSLSYLVKNLDFTHILGERFFPELLLSLSGLRSMSEQVFRESTNAL